MTSTQSRTPTVVSRIVTNPITTSDSPPIARVAAVPTYQTVAPTVAQRVITLVPTICTVPRGKQSKSRRMLVHQLRLQTSKLGKVLDISIATYVLNMIFCIFNMSYMIDHMVVTQAFT